MRRHLLPILLATAVLAVPPLAAAPITGIVSPGGVITLSDEQGPLLELAPMIWGPNWAWTHLAGKQRSEQAMGVVSIAGKLGGSGVPFTLDLRATRTTARQLDVVCTFTAAQESELTLVTLAVTPGARYAGQAHAALAVGDKDLPLGIPFGRGELGRGATRLRVAAPDDAQGITLKFAAPTDVVADGAARVVMAEKSVPANTPRTLHVTVDLPADLTWYASPDDVPYPADWARWYPWQAKAEPGVPSAFGMADWSTEPAGAHGRVARQADRLLVGGQPTKFWGLNVTYSSCAPDKAAAERRAAFYAKMGINAVRLHKYADGPGWAGIQAQDSFAEFDPAALDRMDYFVAQLKARGIYVELSPTFGVGLGSGDRAAVPYAAEFGTFTGRGGERIATKHGAIFLSRELQDLQIRQMTNLLTHTNPYTKLSYAEDPAILVIELFNEDSALFYGTMGQLQNVPTLRQRASEQFADWLTKRYGDEAGLLADWGKGALNSFVGEKLVDESLAARHIVPAGNPWFYDPDQLAGSQQFRRARLLDTMQFLYEQQNDFYRRYLASLRAAGYQGEVLSSNWIAGRALSHYYNLHSDYLIGMIDRHNYLGGSGTMLSRAGSGILSVATCQVADRPFALSEWIHEFPNQYGSEGPALVGAYGMGLQGWDVSFIFENGDDGGYRQLLGQQQWDVMAPNLIGLFPAISRQVRRGDVQPATLVAPRYVHVPSLHEGKLGFDDRAQASGDVKEADSSTVPAAAFAVARTTVTFTDSYRETPVFDLAPHRADGSLVSSTGELRWYEGATTGHVLIDTPATQAIVGFTRDQRFALRDVTIAPHTPFVAIYLTAPGPTDTIRTAKRLLLTAVARVRNTGMKYVGEQLLARGGAPMLMEPVVADLVLTRPGTPVVYVCDHDGIRTPITVPVKDGRFTIDGGVTQTIYYELVYE